MGFHLRGATVRLCMTLSAVCCATTAGAAAAASKSFVNRGGATRVVNRASRVVARRGDVMRSRAVPVQRWYEGEIRRFVRLDTANPPPQQGMLFVGSSIFREWRKIRDFDGDFAPIPSLNRAFGGSDTSDQLEVMDAIVFPHRPRVIVYYCGSNDLNSGVPPTEIRDNFIEWSSRVRERLGPNDVHVVYVSIMKAPQKKPVWSLLDETNRLVEDYCRGEDATNTRYVDVNRALFDPATGQPRHDLYRDDGLHLHPHAYDELLTVMRDELEEVWGEATAGAAAGAAAAGAAGTGKEACDDPFLPPGMR